MGVRHIRTIIRDARRKAGLTQEEMSEGICSVQALSRIETGVCNASSSTFVALLKKANCKCEVYPSFSSMDDFTCYYSLQTARFYIRNQNLSLALNELKKIADINWYSNKLYYQEWLFLECQIQVNSYDYDHQNVLDTLMRAINITRSNFDIVDFGRLFLTELEIEIIISIYTELFHLGKIDMFLKAYEDMCAFLSALDYSSEDKSRLIISSKIPYVYHLIKKQQFDTAIDLSSQLKEKASLSSDTRYLLELQFMQGIGSFYTNQLDKAITLIKSCLYSSNAIESPFFFFCRNYINNNNINIGNMDDLNDFPQSKYQIPNLSPTGKLTSGVYNASSHTLIPIGALIYNKRKELHISQEKISYGLCSKSTLSKIENGVLQPPIYLVESFLQRLGISERVFSFYGNDEDYLFNKLKYGFFYSAKRSKKELTDSLSSLEKISHLDDKIKHQFFLFMKALQIKDTEDKLSELRKALDITFPHNDYKNLNKYRLTWCELSIINNIAKYTYEKQPTEGIDIFYSILDYMNTIDTDIILKTSIFSLTISNFCRALFLQDRFPEQLALAYRYDFSFLKYRISTLGQYFFFMSQINAEMRKYDTARRLAKYSTNISILVGNNINAKVLTDAMAKEYSILL